MSRSTISLFELFQKFPNQEIAREFLEEKRWPNNKHICPHCGFEKITIRKGKRVGYFRCQSCKVEFTVRTNTIFERSHIPLNKWIFGIYLVVTASKGISSMQLAKEIGITQKSAWFMLQRIREACKDDNDDDFMGGIIEVDETYVGGLEKNKHISKRVKGTQGRSTKTKMAVVGMRSRDGQFRAKSVTSVNAKTMQHFLDENIVTNSIISTDEARFYKAVRGYHHFSKKHIDRYIDEFTFRMNDGNVKHHTMDRINSMIDGAFGKRLKYADLIDG